MPNNIRNELREYHAACMLIEWPARMVSQSSAVFSVRSHSAASVLSFETPQESQAAHAV
jgi:hypothetical protein